MVVFFFFKQKTAYEMRISDWSSDVCSSDLAPGLIRYTTQNAIDGGKTRIARPRILVYTTLLVALVTAWAWGVTTRSPLIVDVLRDRNALYRSGSDGRIENGYTVKLVNKVADARSFTIEIESKTP